MGDQTFLVKVVGAASQGAVGAFVGASLSAVTEPVVNKVLVERKSLKQAITEHNVAKIVSFFKTTMSTNFIKFPFFEVVNMIMNSFTVPAALRGTVTGMVFTSATLPITNYRFKKSMNLPTGGISGLYQAYGPTVGRDVVYGVARNKMMGWLLEANPSLMATPSGRFKAMFMTVLFSCVVSAPGNELRGFVLQPKGREKPFMEFFDPVKTVRSTIIGGLIMSLSLGAGAFMTPFVESWAGKIKEIFRRDPLGAIVLIYLLVDRFILPSRVERSEKAITSGTA
mmetsp:Transcript_59060/g.127780  ORF Transcript_59060/g.127780 Transcript_59060/m.127780 type:complete len:282 (+) Transcript_59060:56-901(+)|eukprot:CAMPEP_0170612284 /NCGR_PEP_ID=MMETSP0224-20130122/23642_1 /TAXON_ID=285029 /ORGANISM="Togula jolla, Strain CCCM 725" /LENGTH=281 /DNA_ID=CAMNT_0010937779 /DNA_START=41 /DNA_END=886 /DNA_ORIENTATION=+